MASGDELYKSRQKIGVGLCGRCADLVKRPKVRVNKGMQEQLI